MKMRKVIFPVLFALVLCLMEFPFSAFASSDFGGGDGTEALPYCISTAQHLRTLAEDVNNGTSYEGVYFQMTNDIDLEGSEDNQWIPIGVYSRYSPEEETRLFAGVFDGMGHVVRGIYIDNSSYGGTDLGLFSTNSGTVQNLGVSGIIKGKHRMVGSVVAQNWGIVRNCYNAGTELFSENYLGGVVGITEHPYLIGLDGDSLVEGCYNEIPIIMTDSTALVGVGGVIGYVDGPVKSCYNTGDIFVSGNSKGVGGIAGGSGCLREEKAEGSVTDGGCGALIENCYNTGNITVVSSAAVEDSGGLDTGGIVGESVRTIYKNCYNSGEIVGCASVGGLTGSSMEDVFENCYNENTVSNTPEWTGIDALIGCEIGAQTQIKNCYYNNELCFSEFGEGKSGASFENGEVTYLLQKNQEEQVWGQGLPEDSSPVLTAELSKRVYQVTFVSEDNPAYTVYTNSMVEKPTDPVSETTDKQFSFWSANQEETGTAFDFQVPISADTILYAHWKTVSTSPSTGGGGSSSGGNSSSGGGSSSSDKDKPATSPSPEAAGPTQAGSDLEELSPEETVLQFLPVAEQFTDVSSGDWFEEAVQYAWDKGLLNGVSEDTFAPEAPASRAMVVTILYRLEGEPKAVAADFSDVGTGKYYANAVGWATQSRIVNGFEDQTFRPDGPITREQLTVLLYRYAAKRGWDMGYTADLSAYVDMEQISSYALPAMSWAKAVGLVNGTDWGGLNPGGTATRAETAAILMRFCESVMK